MTEQEILKLIELNRNGLLDEKQTIALQEVLKQRRKERAFKNYAIFAPEYIKIVNKDGEKVPFNHNKIQRVINDTVLELRAARKPVRIIILKPRQPGVSTNEQGRMLFNTTTKENRVGLIVAHVATSTSTLFEKAKFMYDNLPPHVQPLKKASNATELVFDRPTNYKGKEKGLHSKISIQVAGDVSIGRGDTIHFFHGSEVALWPAPDGKEIKKQISGIMAAIPKTPDTEAVLESTARGYNEFKELCDEALEHKNEWTLLFFAWHDHEPNQMECTNEELQRLLDTIDDDDVREYLIGSKEEPGIIKTFNLTKEQIKWWIWTFRNDNNNDLSMMKQENPSSYNEAFIASGTPIFNNAKINTRIEFLRRKYKTDPPRCGRFSFQWDNPDTENFIKDNTIKWVDDPHGFIKIYEMPQPGVPYVNGGDTKGESLHSDLYAGTAINNITGNRAAVLHGQWSNSKPYTWQMYCLGKFYNIALIGIEMNWNTAPIEELERLHYPRQYMRKKYDDATGEFKTAHGWKTDGNTRPLIVDKEIHLINKNIGLFNDIDMLNECITFVRKDGRPDAMSGKHDDILISDMIANEIRRHQSFELDLDKEPVTRGTFDEDNERDTNYNNSPYN